MSKRKTLNYDILTGEHELSVSLTDQLLARSDRSPLYTIRKQQGLTLSVLAKATGISASYLSRIESRSRRMNEDIINRLCIVLKCSPVQLISSPIKKYDEYEYRSASALCDLPVYQTITGDAIPGGNENDLYLNLSSIQEKVFRPAELIAERAAFALIILNTDNAPKYRKDDIIYINPSLDADISHSVILIDHYKKYVVGELIEKTDKNITVKTYGTNDIKKCSTDDIKALYVICMTLEGYCR